MDTTQIENKFRHLEARVEDQFKDVSNRVRVAGSRVADVVREHPAATLAGAFAIGYLLARMARR